LYFAGCPWFQFGFAAVDSCEWYFDPPSIGRAAYRRSVPLPFDRPPVDVFACDFHCAVHAPVGWLLVQILIFASFGLGSELD
jgi:hypothetical protein